MVPIGVVGAPRVFARATWLFVGLCLIIHLVMWSLSEPGYRAVVSTWGLIPATIWIPLEGSEDIAGMSLWLTTLTYTFLHGDWVHVTSNMLFLAVFGPLIEYRMGVWRFIAFAAGAAFVAGLSFLVANPGSIKPLIGASGMVSGLMGLFSIWFRHEKIRLFFPVGIMIYEVRAGWLLAIWFVIQLILAALGDARNAVAFSAHIGGFLCGIIMGLLVRDDRYASGFHRTRGPWES